jgi:membrane fusion protein (multidrug efflux system)
VSAAAAPPPNVQIVEVTQRDVPVYHEYLATLDGFVNAQIQPQGFRLPGQAGISGRCAGGQNARCFFKIDPRPFQAIVDQS